MNGNRDAGEQLGEAAQALVSENVSVTCLLNGPCTTITTNELPKDSLAPEYSKSPIVVEWRAPATPCHLEAGGTLHSADEGKSYVPNSESKQPGYMWSVDSDLAGLENHWHNEIGCDGLTTMVGCPKGRTIYYSLSVYGACLTASGTCTATGSVLLPAIEDDPVTVTNCPGACGELFGDCMKECSDSCGSGNPDCHSCCECNCKHKINVEDENSACPAPQSSCDPACF